jgi:prepilin peptidase CpaA
MTIQPQTVYLPAALFCAVIASAYDLGSRRIPNALTGPAIVAGLALHLILGGPAQLGLSLLAGLLAGAIFFVFFLAGGMGAGDVKLIAAVGCLAGIGSIKDILLITVLAGAVMGIGLALYRGRLFQTLANVGTLIGHHRVAGITSHPELNVSNPATLRLPYALPIAVGCLLTCVLSVMSGVAQ